MKLEDIIPTHNSLRNPMWVQNKLVSIYDNYKPFRTLIENVLNEQDTPLSILQTEDDKLYLLDGHHRMCVLSRLTSNFLLKPEWYQVVKYSYAEMQEINWECGYVTPFDPRTECRKVEFWSYKSTIKRLREYMPDGQLESFIMKNRDLYTLERKVDNIHSLHAQYDFMYGS